MPKPDARTKRAQHADDDAPKLTRLAAMVKDKVTPPLPPNPMPEVINRLIEIGLFESSGMGMSPISWREIDAWCSRNVDLQPWESRLIRSLSAAYVAENKAAESETSPAPWHSPVTKREAEIEDEQLRMLLG